MADTVRWTGSTSPQRTARSESGQSGTDLADILERVLDKGIVIAGDIQVNLLDIELLTIKIRLVVASVDRAKEMGIDWWERDPTLSAGRSELEDENARLRERIERLEAAASGDGPDDGQGRDAAELPEGRDARHRRPDRERQPSGRADPGPDDRSVPEDEPDEQPEDEPDEQPEDEPDEQPEDDEQPDDEPDEQPEPEDGPEPEDRAEPEAEETDPPGDDEDTDERPRRQRAARPKRRR